ncbi:MAG: hypothetical protein U0T77_10220 [Chitinophagales bacterium]
MSSFFVLNSTAIPFIPESFSGAVIFYKKSKEPAVAEAQMGLMQKLIENGLKLSMENFLFIDILEHPVRITALRKHANLTRCFLFGVLENEVGLNASIPLYQLVQLASMDILKSDAPEILEKNSALKSKLWKQLQISFKLA